MNITKKDLKSIIQYWAKDSYAMWKQLSSARKEIKRLKKVIGEMKNDK